MRVDVVKSIAISVLLTVGLYLVMVTCSPPAQADSVDDQFIAALEEGGITVENEAGIIAYAHWICEGLATFGVPVYPMRDLITTHQQVAPETAEFLMGEAAHFYCPEITSDEDKRTTLA